MSCLFGFLFFLVSVFEISIYNCISQNLVLKEVNLHSLAQLNALSQMRRLESISIEISPGNPVTQFSLWRPYLLFRLAHFSIRKINGTDVSAVIFM